MSKVAVVAVAGAHLEVEDEGSGEPVVVIQTALSVDEMRPLCAELRRAGDLRVVHVHRPGYRGSGPAHLPGSVQGDADLVASVVRALDLGPTHIVGASFSSAVALTLAATHPELTAAVVAVESPPYGTAGHPEFLAVLLDFQEIYRQQGAAVALERCLHALFGAAWREQAERDLPGSVADIERDAPAFFERDLPALQTWQFADELAAAVRCPALCVGGGDTSTWFAEMNVRLAGVLPQASTVTIAGGGHDVALTHAAETAEVVVDHVRRHRR